MKYMILSSNFKGYQSKILIWNQNHTSFSFASSLGLLTDFGAEDVKMFARVKS